MLHEQVRLSEQPLRGKKRTLISFVIPIKERTIGMVEYKAASPAFTAWNTKPDTLHICMCGLTSTMTVPLLRTIVEFTEVSGVPLLHG
jgi:hypothetical protein